MSQPLLELKSLLVSRASVSGRVISFSNGMARVATPGGIIEVATNTSIQAGEQVVVMDGRAIKSRVMADAPVFSV